MASDDAISSLREALRHSPDNIPLRTHLAEQLLAAGRGEDAVEEFKAALAARPDDAKLKVGLATAFHQQGKHSAAMVIVEDLVKQRDVPPKATMLYARLLLKAGDVERAVRQYKKAVEADASVADLELASLLGISATADTPSIGDVVDGKVRTAWDDAAGDDEVAEVERPKISFKDVGGMDAVKDEI
jgi:predicted Zn-dependent protease